MSQCYFQVALLDCIRTRSSSCNAAARIGSDFSLVGRHIRRAGPTAMAVSSMGSESNEPRRNILYRRVPTPAGSFDHSSDVLVYYVLFAAVGLACVIRTIGDRRGRAR